MKERPVAGSTTDIRRPPASSESGTRLARIRARALVVGLLLIPFDNYWVIIMEKVRSGPYVTTVSLFANVVFILAAIIALNSLLKKFFGRAAFTMAEMLLIYTMVAIGAALAGHDLVPTVCMFLGYPWRFTTPESNWLHTFIPHLPKWLSVSDPAVLRPFYEGNSSLYTDGHWQPFIEPVLGWTFFVIVLFFVMMCINTLVRKQWVDHERLTFPIVQLPVAMTEPKGALWRNRLFWIGFGIAFGLGLMNGLAVYFPAIPRFNMSHIGHNLRDDLTTKPFDGIDWLPYSFYPFVIGLGYLLPTDLSFSCWFFYLFWKLQMVVTRGMGWDATPDFPFIRHQTFGGYAAIVLMFTWTGRHYLKQMWLKIIGGPSELDDSDEPMSYRSAAAGAILGFVLLCVFMGSMGMSPVVVVAAFVIYFMLATSIARMRAELGPPVHDLHFIGPDQVISRSVGLENLSKGDMVGLTYFYWFNRAYRCHPMPIGLEGMKMAQQTRSSQRVFMWGMMAAAVVGTVSAFWAFLHTGFAYGLSGKMVAGTWFSNEAFSRLGTWWKHPYSMERPDWGSNIAMLLGFLVCVLLAYARLQIFNFPFHPIGFAISGSWSMNLVWVPIMFAWLLKLLTLKYGGLKLYKTAVPFFFGLILGDMTMGCLWSLFGIIFNIPAFNFWGA